MAQKKAQKSKITTTLTGEKRKPPVEDVAPSKIIVAGMLWHCPKQEAIELVAALDKGSHRGDVIISITIYNMAGEPRILKTRADCIQGVIE